MERVLSKLLNREIVNINRHKMMNNDIQEEEDNITKEEIEVMVYRSY